MVRQGKGKEDHFVPISERAMNWVMKYLEDVRPDFAIPLPSSRDAENLFLDKTGQALNPDQLSRLAAKYIKQADIGKTGSCHLFRHTVATLMLDNGADILFIQQVLGHVSIGTTEIYTHVSIVKLKQVHEMTHPTMHRYRQLKDEIAATRDELLMTLDAESEEESEEES